MHLFDSQSLLILFSFHFPLKFQLKFLCFRTIVSDGLRLSKKFDPVSGELLKASLQSIPDSVILYLKTNFLVCMIIFSAISFRSLQTSTHYSLNRCSQWRRSYIEILVYLNQSWIIQSTIHFILLTGHWYFKWIKDLTFSESFLIRHYDMILWVTKKEVIIRIAKPLVYLILLMGQGHLFHMQELHVNRSQIKNTEND